MNTLIAKEQDTSSLLPEHRLFGSQKKKRRLLALSLFVITLLAYNPASRFQFVNYDDHEYVTLNLHVQQGLHWRTVGWALTTFEFYNWHPLTWITFLIDYQLFKLNPAGYHFMNVVYHGLAAVLLFLVLHRGTGYPGRSFCVALLFALHPLNIGSVAWVSERKNVLSTIFWFLAIWAYGWYALRPGWKRYLILTACFMLGLMAKGTVITLPCVLLLLDIWPLRRVKSSSSQPEEDPKTGLNFVRKSWSGLVLEKLPLFLLSALSTVVTIRALKGLSIPNVPLGVRIENAVIAYVLYLYKAFFPRHLAVFYPIPSHYLSVWKVVVCAILLLAVTVLVLRLRQRQPYLSVGWFWFLGILAPVIRIFPAGDEAMADRYAYIPLIGLFFAVVWAIADWSVKLPYRFYWLGATSMLLLVALAADFRVQLPVWENSLALWSHAIQVDDPNNALAHTNLGRALTTAGRLDEAAQHFYRSEELNPKDAGTHYYIGRYLLQQGRTDEAIAEYEQALYWTSDPLWAVKTRFDLGLAFTKKRQLFEAEANYRAAIELDPDDNAAYINLGILLYSEKKLDQAMGMFVKAIQIKPDAFAYFWMGRILQDEGKLSGALEAYQAALRISPDLILAQQSIRAISQTEKAAD